MATAKLSILGSDYIGAFSLANDSFSLVCKSSTKGEHSAMVRNLEVPVHDFTVNGSDLIGIYAACNSHSLILPSATYASEAKAIKKQLDDVNVAVFDTDLNALGNNILANDRRAIINPNYSSKEAKKIADIMDVEVVKMGVGGFETVGANNLLTNSGIVLNNRVTEEEEALLKELFKSVSQSTANLGALSIGLCAIANSKGLLVGRATTGHELVSMSEGLGF